jgi:hypothetical protein
VPAAVAVSSPEPDTSIVVHGPNNGQIAETINNNIGAGVRFTPVNEQQEPSSITVAQGDSCPLQDPSDPVRPEATVTVEFWCKGDVFDVDGNPVVDQTQIKLKPSIVNKSPTKTFDISLRVPSSLRLLVRGQQVTQRWSPPPLTRAAGDSVRMVKWGDQNFYGIPPNQPGDVQRLKRIPVEYSVIANGLVALAGYTGFATAWDGDALPPGTNYYRPVR